MLQKLKIFSIFILVIGLIAPNVIAASKTLYYKYDALGRVVEVKDNVNEDRKYKYDAAGNRAEVAVGEDNQAPIANPDSVSLPGSFIPITVYVLSNDSDPDGDTLSISSYSASTSTISVTKQGNTLKISALYGAPSQSTVSYTISDGHGNSDTSIITVRTTSGGRY